MPASLAALAALTLPFICSVAQLLHWLQGLKPLVGGLAESEGSETSASPPTALETDRADMGGGGQKLAGAAQSQHITAQAKALPKTFRRRNQLHSQAQREGDRETEQWGKGKTERGRERERDRRERHIEFDRE